MECSSTTEDAEQDCSVIQSDELQNLLILLSFFQDFKKETGLQYTLYCDPDREIYSALNLGTDYVPVDLGSK